MAIDLSIRISDHLTEWLSLAMSKVLSWEFWVDVSSRDKLIKVVEKLDQVSLCYLLLDSLKIA
jgi:hypothetical protein